MRRATASELESVFERGDIDWFRFADHITDNGFRVISIDRDGYIHIAAHPDHRANLVGFIKRSVRHIFDSFGLDVIYAAPKKRAYNVCRLADLSGFEMMGPVGDKMLYKVEKSWVL